jgi:transcriptional regulator with XRE-family HTH domain
MMNLVNQFKTVLSLLLTFLKFTSSGDFLVTELAKLLKTSDTQLSEIMHKKRKPSVAFLKSIHQFLGIDGNVLLRLA